MARFRSLFRPVWLAYKWLAIAVGTIVIVPGSAALYARLFVPEPIASAQLLDSGFVFDDDLQDGRIAGHRLADLGGRTQGFSDVTRFTEYGDVIYGGRYDIRHNVVYFFCIYGTDCIDTQSLSESELNAITAARGLPPYGEPGRTSDRHRLARDARFDR